MARKDENRVRDAQFLANADRYLTDKPTRSLVDIARSIRQNLIKARTEVAAEPNLSLEPNQKPC